MKSTTALDHIAIRVSSLSTSVPWYLRYFSGRQMWELTEFSDVTRTRLPGISKLVEVVAGDMKFHLFEQGDAAAAGADVARGVQHVGIHVGSLGELRGLRDRCIELGLDPAFASCGSPTELAADATTKTVSFYCTDPDGTEFEFIADGLAADLR